MKTKLKKLFFGTLTAAALFVALVSINARQLQLSNPSVWTNCTECDPLGPVVAQGTGFDGSAAVRVTWSDDWGDQATLTFPVSPDGTWESAVTGLYPGHWVLDVEQAKNRVRFISVAQVEVEVL